MESSAYTCMGVKWVIVLKYVIPLLFEIVKCSIGYEHCHVRCRLSGDFFSGSQIWGLQTFSFKKHQIKKILGFACYTVSVAYSVILGKQLQKV